MRRDSERGASLVEFALIFPVLALILLGVVSGGLALSRQNSVENAVREGTRFGAVNPISTPENAANIQVYLDQVLTQAANGATGDLSNGTDGRFLCAAFYDGSTAYSRSETSDPSTRVTGAAMCFADGRTDRRVQVVARRSSPIELLFSDIPVTIDSRSVTRYERS